MEGPANGFTLMGGMVRPLSRGTIRLCGPDGGRPAGTRPQHPGVRRRPRQPRRRRRVVPTHGREPRSAGVGRRRTLPRPGRRRPSTNSGATSERRRSPTTIRLGRARWVATRWRWSIRGFESAAWRAARRGCLGDAHGHDRQYQCPVDHDRRAGRGLRDWRCRGGRRQPGAHNGYRVADAVGACRKPNCAYAGLGSVVSCESAGPPRQCPVQTLFGTLPASVNTKRIVLWPTSAVGAEHARAAAVDHA